MRKKRELFFVQETRLVKFGKIFSRSRPARLEDPFELLPLCRGLGLEAKAPAILSACLPSVAIDIAEPRNDLPHSGSCLGGYPALPDNFEWPRQSDGEPMKFLGQFTCSELTLAKLTGLPEEGLLSIFLDTFDDEANEVFVYHFSLKQDLLRRQGPRDLGERPAFRPTFHPIPSLPRPGSIEYTQLALDEDEQDAYYQLLIELEESLEPCQLRCGGHPPFCDEDGCYPEQGGEREWSFFLALRDIEELELVWPETGAVMIWAPKGVPISNIGTATLTWQTVDDWEEEDDDDEETDEER